MGSLLSKSSLMITALFVLGIIGAYSVYKPFVLSLVVAMLLTMATFNLTKRLVDYTNSAHVSAMISTVLLMLLLFAPIAYLATIGVGYISQIDSSGVKETVHFVQSHVEDIPFLREMSFKYLNDEKIAFYIEESTSYLTFAGGAGLGFMKNMFFVVVFYFLLITTGVVFLTLS